MKCSYHSEMDANGACINCGRLVCKDCQIFYRDKSYCKPCFDSWSSNNPTQVSTKRRNRKPNWFERHLNITILVGVAAIFALELLIGFFIGITGIILYLTDGELDIIGWIIYIVLLLILLGWVLVKKKRSLAWLFMLFVPFGWITFFVLTNRNQFHVNDKESTGSFEQIGKP